VSEYIIIIFLKNRRFSAACRGELQFAASLKKEFFPRYPEKSYYRLSCLAAQPQYDYHNNSDVKTQIPDHGLNSVTNSNHAGTGALFLF
jgi:hypothetical protein